MERAHRRAQARARSLAYGRRRAARRVEAGRFTPHPGWRHRVPAGVVVLRDQAAALARVDELISDEQLWRTDRRAVALAVLRGLVCGMAWDSGLVTGITRTHLAGAAGCSTRTVSRVLAWAIAAGLVVCVESGASAEFLGTATNRAPSYVLTGLPSTVPGDEHGNPPAYGGSQTSPRRHRGLEDRQDDHPWPVYARAATPSERARAVGTFLERAGITGKVVRWRAVAMLGPWFETGWCVKGLLHAVDHHPDRPDQSQGDAARAARDPLRVLGHRLAPWRGRLTELPATLAAADGRSAATDHGAGRPPARSHRPPPATLATRAAARNAIAQTLAGRSPASERSLRDCQATRRRRQG